MFRMPVLKTEPTQEGGVVGALQPKNLQVETKNQLKSTSFVLAAAPLTFPFADRPLQSLSKIFSSLGPLKLGRLSQVQGSFHPSLLKRLNTNSKKKKKSERRGFCVVTHPIDQFNAGPARNCSLSGSVSSEWERLLSSKVSHPHLLRVPLNPLNSLFSICVKELK